MVVNVVPEEPACYRITVADSGVGIRAEDVPRLFTEFGQLGTARKAGSGTGLGLAITRQIVEKQGGRIGCRSLCRFLTVACGNWNASHRNRESLQGRSRRWCENVTPQEARNRAATDPHWPAHFRLNGTLQNMPEFQKAYACRPDASMVRPAACRGW